MTILAKRYRLFVIADNTNLLVTDTDLKVGWNIDLQKKEVRYIEYDQSHDSNPLYMKSQRLIDIRRSLHQFGAQAILEEDDLSFFIDNEDLFEIEQHGVGLLLC